MRLRAILAGALDIEGAGDFPFADFVWCLAAQGLALAGDEGQNFFARRQTFVAPFVRRLRKFGRYPGRMRSRPAVFFTRA